MTTTTAEPGARRGRGPFAADERLLQQHRVGPVDRLPAGGILALLPQLPDWPSATVHRTRRLRGAATLLVWVLGYVAIQGIEALDWGFITDTPPGNPSGSVLNFGRYLGWSLGEIARYDLEYIEWLDRTPIGRIYQVELDDLLRTHGRRVSAPPANDKTRGLFRRR